MTKIGLAIGSITMLIAVGYISWCFGWDAGHRQGADIATVNCLQGAKTCIWPEGQPK